MFHQNDQLPSRPFIQTNNASPKPPKKNTQNEKSLISQKTIAMADGVLIPILCSILHNVHKKNSYYVCLCAFGWVISFLFKKISSFLLLFLSPSSTYINPCMMVVVWQVDGWLVGSQIGYLVVGVKKESFLFSQFSFLNFITRRKYKLKSWDYFQIFKSNGKLEKAGEDTGTQRVHSISTGDLVVKKIKRTYPWV